MRSHFLLFIFFFLLTLTTTGDPSARAEYAGFTDPGARTAGGNAGAGLVPVEETIDGGKIPIGATAQVVVRFRNDGSQPVETGLIRLYPSSTVSASIALNQCEEEPLAAGAECAIALSIKGLQAGPWRVEMLMSHSGRTRLVTSTISGTVESTGDASQKQTSDIEVNPDTIDFGTLNSAQTLTKPIILRNITSVPVDIKDVYVDASESSGFSLKAEGCKTLQAGQSCIAVVTWAPKAKGRASGVVVVKHTGPAALSSVPLAGEYNPEDPEQAQVFPQAVPGKGLLVASQTTLDFGGDVETASTITVSLVNVGDSSLTIKDIHLSGSDNGLSTKDNGCKIGTVLEPVEACPLTVSWSPTRIGALFDDIQIVHDGARGVLVLPIRGTAKASVSQDQKAIMLSGDGAVIANPPGHEESTEDQQLVNAGRSSAAGGGINPASVLDGYKITSFSPTRAIINGPGGSRLVFDNEETVLGGIPWFVVIQKNGIEFLHEGQRILLLFDRSLSSVNRISASSETSGGSTPAASGTTKPAPSSGGTNG